VNVAASSSAKPAPAEKSWGSTEKDWEPELPLPYIAGLTLEDQNEWTQASKKKSKNKNKPSA